METRRDFIAPAITVGLLWIFLWYLLGFTLEFSIYGTAFLFVTMLAFIDFKSHLIPNRYVIAMGAIGVVVLPLNPFVKPFDVLLGVLIVGGLLFLASRITKGQIGMGDAKLFAAISIFFGLKGGFMILLYALLISGILGLALIAFGRVTRKTSLPFAPFVLVGMTVELLLKF